MSKVDMLELLKVAHKEIWFKQAKDADRSKIGRIFKLTDRSRFREVYELNKSLRRQYKSRFGKKIVHVLSKTQHYKIDNHGVSLFSLEPCITYLQETRI